MAAGHSAITEQAGKIPGFIDEGMDKNLKHLGNAPGNDGGYKELICNKIEKKIHKNFLYVKNSV